MEETLGRRIASGRKALNLTQDQLAEKLGVTAQAVSKWENDQSCPDITMLPKLAALFDTSVDALLGVEQEEVHQAEVVQEPAPKKRKWDWDFRFDDVSAGRAGSICFALMILLCGVLLLLRSVLQLHFSFWDVLWPSGLLFFGISGLLRRNLYFSIGCTLFGGIFLLNNTGLVPLDVDRGWVFPVLLILFGLSLLPHAFKKKRPVFSFTYGDDGEKRSQKNEFHEEDGFFECVCSFGDSRQLITTPTLRGGSITTSFGDHTIDLQGCQTAIANAVIDATCSFGDTKILVPRHIRLVPDRRTSFGEVNTSGQPNSDATAVILNANVSFGELSIRYL